MYCMLVLMSQPASLCHNQLQVLGALGQPVQAGHHYLLSDLFDWGPWFIAADNGQQLCRNDFRFRCTSDAWCETT